MELAKKIKIARIDAELSQKQLSELTGLKQEYISKLESGEIKTLYKKTEEKLRKILYF